MRLTYLAIILSTLLLGCTKVSYWTSTPGAQNDSAPYSTEIQITDSTFTDYAYNTKENSMGGAGLCSIRKSHFNGDTLMIYKVNYHPNQNDSASYILKSTIVEAYIKDGKKLFPIHKGYPHMYGSYDPDNNLEVAADSSGIQKFKVHWENWTTESAYIDYNGVYQKKGKYKSLRKFLKEKTQNSDAVLWYIYYPKEIIDDTTYSQIKTVDNLGPLKNNGL